MGFGFKKLAGLGLFLLVFCGVSGLSFASFAREDVDLGKSGLWQAQAFQESKQKGSWACVEWAKPSQIGKGISRKKVPYASVTHRPYKKRAGEVVFYMGFPVKDNSVAVVEIDAHSFQLTAKGDYAFVDPRQGMPFMFAMRTGHKMIIHAIDKDNKQITDTYALRGFTTANDKINKACGLRLKH